MNILSIQSHVAYGHVGNSAAVFPLQRIGVEVWPVQTVQFSNHPGYGAWRGRVFSAATIRLVVQGIEERGVLGECDGVISGYLGSPDTGEAVVESVARVKGANPPARTAEAGASEMLLVEAQDELVTPSEVFVAHRI